MENNSESFEVNTNTLSKCPKCLTYKDTTITWQSGTVTILKNSILFEGQDHVNSIECSSCGYKSTIINWSVMIKERRDKQIDVLLENNMP